jgi:diacylglycerol kinase family enzyme
MYYYLYDNFLVDKKFERVLAAVETRLTDLGISGKIGRLTPFTNAKGLIRDEVRRGTDTIVVVGNDETISKAIEGIGDANITLGIIPIGTPTHIAQSLGIPDGVEACDVLSKRVTKKIDLGLVNGRYFLSSVKVLGNKAVIEGEGQYRISSELPDCELVVSNLRSPDMEGTDVGARVPGDPMDGFLDALIVQKPTGFLSSIRKKQGPTVIPMKRLRIASPEPVEAVADGRAFVNKDIDIEIVPDCLKIITGRSRVFV